MAVQIIEYPENYTKIYNLKMDCSESLSDEDENLSEVESNYATMERDYDVFSTTSTTTQPKQQTQGEA